MIALARENSVRDNAVRDNVASLFAYSITSWAICCKGTARPSVLAEVDDQFELGRRLNGKRAELTGSSRRCHTVA